MKRNDVKDEITSLTYRQAVKLAMSTDYEQYKQTKWEQGNDDKLAQQLYKQKEPWYVCRAHFIVRLKKRKLALDVMTDIARYYMARAQVRITKQRKEN